MLALGLFLAGCWDEKQFTQECLDAGHCIVTVTDAGSTGGGAATGGGTATGGGAATGGGTATGGGGGIPTGCSDAGVNRLSCGLGTITGLTHTASSQTWDDVVADLLPASNTDASFTTDSITLDGGGFIGGLLLPSGSVLCVPYTGRFAAELLPDAGVLRHDVLSGGFEGAVLLSNGAALLIPNTARGRFTVLWPDGGVSTFDPLPDIFGELPFEGAVITIDGDVLLAPSTTRNYASFNPVSGELRVFLQSAPSNPTPRWYAGLVLLADGRTALLVPRDEARAALVTVSTLTPFVDVAGGYAGGLLLANGDVMLTPHSVERPFVQVGLDGGVSPGIITSKSFFSATWSTNGFGYAFQADVSNEGRVVSISRSGGLATVASGVADFLGQSHYGFVARADGVIIGCPYTHARAFVFKPNVQRTVDAGTMLSPWLNKW